MTAFITLKRFSLSSGVYGVTKAVFDDLAFEGEVPVTRLKVFEK